MATDTKKKDKKKEKLGENEMTYLKFKETYMNFKKLGQIGELPISKVLALNIRKMQPMIEDKEEEMDAIIDEYAKLDESGERLGIYHDVYDENGKVVLDEDGKPKQERYDLSGNYHYGWIDVGDDEKVKKEYEEKIEDFLKQPVEYKFHTVPSNKEVAVRVPREYDTNGRKEVKYVEVERELLDVLSDKVSANMINILLDTIVKLVD